MLTLINPVEDPNNLGSRVFRTLDWEVGLAGLRARARNFHPWRCHLGRGRNLEMAVSISASLEATEVRSFDEKGRTVSISIEHPGLVKLGSPEQPAFRHPEHWVRVYLDQPLPRPTIRWMRSERWALWRRLLNAS